MAKIDSIWTKLVSGVGFSNGWAALALKKPPPLVPSILMATLRGDRPLGDASAWRPRASSPSV